MPTIENLQDSSYWESLLGNTSQPTLGQGLLESLVNPKLCDSPLPSLRGSPTNDKDEWNFDERVQEYLDNKSPVPNLSIYELLSPETKKLFDEAASKLKVKPIYQDIRPEVILSQMTKDSMVNLNSRGISVDLGPVGAVAAALGFLLLSTGGSDSATRVKEAEQEAEEARESRRAAETKLEEERLAREKAEEEAREAEEAAEKAKRLHEREQEARELGIPPERDITEDNIRDAKKEARWVEGCIHVAVIGNQNVGKSSLVNACRGLTDEDNNAAPVSECQMIAPERRYPDQRHPRFIWYDIPGAGTEHVKDWQYYHDQKLFIYDIVILANHSTLTVSDLRILKICDYRNQKCIVVRTKTDGHIYNRTGRKGISEAEAGRQYIAEARRDSEETRKKASEAKGPKSLGRGWFEYLVSSRVVYRLVNGLAMDPSKPAQQIIYEREFLQELGLME
ncbi:hypothetical protein BDZ45DRAFT_660306 [Acephala macrosclerotiorum]|nr:hypothetical protein BDZ45DRAFT_660306 [Acephala macrosclerotiorum]